MDFVPSGGELPHRVVAVMLLVSNTADFLLIVCVFSLLVVLKALLLR